MAGGGSEEGMRLSTKKEIIKLLETLSAAIQYLEKGRGNEAVKKQILEDCETALSSVFTMFQEQNLSEKQMKKKVQEIRSGILSIKLLQNPGNLFRQLIVKLLNLKEMIEKEIIGTLEIVFLPYKYSMWDCMDSIWEAADKDPSCICHVVPIPYYDIKPDGSTGARHYERQEFPMVTESYEACDLEAIRPDIIYIHNPYDNGNWVTSVEPRFYSKQLKKYTDMLVYVPFYLFNFTVDYRELAGDCNRPGCKNADRIILQSGNLKSCYIENGIPDDKLIVLGSPKIDMILNKKDCYTIPASWKKALEGRKVILLNSSLNTFLSRSEWLKNIETVIKDCLLRNQVALIFRPHPLMEATIDSMRPDSRQLYQQILEILETSEQAIIDKGQDALPAIGVSDALISDYSSILPQYVFTGKPALSLLHSSKARKHKVFCDYFSDYFIEDGVTVNDFLDMALRGEDEKKEERLKFAKASVANSDGTSGKKIHDYITTEVRKSR